MGKHVCICTYIFLFVFSVLCARIIECICVHIYVKAYVRFFVYTHICETFFAYTFCVCTYNYIYIYKYVFM
jgi:hypothetical protein